MQFAQEIISQIPSCVFNKYLELSIAAVAEFSFVFTSCSVQSEFCLFNKNRLL